MKNIRKNIAMVLTVAISLFAFIGCTNPPEEPDNTVEGNGTTSSQSENLGNEDEVTLNFWHHYSAQSAENETLVNTLIPKFESENPDIKVNAVSHEWADLHDKILINANAGTLPDVARLDIAWIPEFQKAGLLVALDEEIDDFDSVSNQLLENAMSTTYVSGHSYGLALNTNTKILFYNTKALVEINREAPATMDEFVAIARELAGVNENGQKIWGYAEPALSGWNILPFIWSFGGEITNAEQTKASGYINSPETVKAIEMFVDLYKENVITGWNSGDIPLTDGFGTERYMMILEGPWKIAELAGAYPDMDYATANMPTGDGGSHSVLGGEDISMFTSANKDEAWKFMKFMTSEYSQIEMAKTGQIPVNKAALESDTVKAAEFAPFLEAIEQAKSRPTVAKWSEIDNELSVAITSVMNDDVNAQTAMDELAEIVDALLVE